MISLAEEAASELNEEGELSVERRGRQREEILFVELEAVHAFSCSSILHIFSNWGLYCPNNA